MSGSKARRLSVDNWHTNLVSRIGKTKEALSELWDEMALSEEQRKERLKDSEKLVFELLDNMVNFEQKQLEEVKRKCLQFRQEADELRHELGLPPLSDAAIPKGLAPSGNWLKNECKALIKKKKEHMVEQLEVYNEVKEACDRVGWDIVSSENVSTHLVPIARVMEWKKQKIEADNVYNARMKEITELQASIRKIVKHIGRTRFKENDLSLVDMDYNKYTAILAAEVVESFKDLFNRAQEEYNGWYESIQFEYDELMVELQDLWELCIVAECDRFFPKNFNPDIQTVEDVDNLRNEIAQMRLRYAEGKVIYDKLREWLNIWNEKLEFEDESKNSKEKYNNRGGSLQARLKRENQLKNLVPKILSELEALCEEHRKTHQNIPCAGPAKMHAGEYARWLVRSYEDEKILDKMNKEEHRRYQLAQESRFGVSPSPSKSTSHARSATPSKSGLHSIRSTPIKKTPRKPVLGFNTSKTQSIIEPVLTPIDGPKTSSPKNMMYDSPRRVLFSPALSSITSSPLSKRQLETKSPSRPWRY